MVFGLLLEVSLRVFVGEMGCECLLLLIGSGFWYVGVLDGLGLTLKTRFSIVSIFLFFRFLFKFLAVSGVNT